MGRTGFAILSALTCAIATTLGLYAIGLGFRCGSEYALFVTLLGILVAVPLGLIVGGLVGAAGYANRRTVATVEIAVLIVAIAACITLSVLPNFVRPNQQQCSYE